MSGSKFFYLLRSLLQCIFICVIIVCSAHVICLLEINSVARIYSVIGVQKLIPKSWARNRYNTIINLLLKECLVYSFQDGIILFLIGILRSSMQLFMALLREFLVITLSVVALPSLKGTELITLQDFRSMTVVAFIIITRIIN